MDSLIFAYVDDTFNELVKEDILKTFDLFEKFDYKDAESGFIDILNNGSYATAGDLQDRFILELNTKLDFIISQHLIKLSNDTSIEQKIKICEGFYKFQYLEDYTGIISILESLESDYEKMSLILSDLTDLDDTIILSILENVNTSLLGNMKRYIYTRESTATEEITTEDKIHIKAKLFFEYLKEITVGESLVRSGMLTGMSFETYLNYCEEDLVFPTDEQTAKNILSVLLMSIDGSENTLITYKKYSYRLLQDLNKTSRVETYVLRLLNNFDEYRKAKDEKDRLSKTSYTA